MINITNKTKRTELIARLESQKSTIEKQNADNLRLECDLIEVRAQLANAKHTIEVRDTDVHNLLGALRVMADSSREVRIRKSTVRDAEFAMAMPARNVG